MKLPKQHLRNRTLLLFLLLLGCVILLTAGTYAAYTSSASVKRVVAARTQEANKLCFSSNILTDYPFGYSDYAIRPISADNSGLVTISITVSNYPKDDPSHVNQSTIGYTVTAEVRDLSGCTAELYVTGGELPGGIKSDNMHTLTITGSKDTDFSTGYVIVEVTPNEDSAAAVDHKKLAARLKIVPTAAGASAWRGDIKLAGEYKDNDAINYHIYGTEQCEMELTWNKKYIELGDWSRELLGVDDTTYPLVISVGGPGKPTSYLLQFYRVQPAGDESSESLIQFKRKDSSIP